MGCTGSKGSGAESYSTLQPQPPENDPALDSQQIQNQTKSGKKSDFISEKSPAEEATTTTAISEGASRSDIHSKKNSDTPISTEFIKPPPADSRHTKSRDSGLHQQQQQQQERSIVDKHPQGTAEEEHEQSDQVGDMGTVPSRIRKNKADGAAADGAPKSSKAESSIEDEMLALPTEARGGGGGGNPVFEEAGHFSMSAAPSSSIPPGYSASGGSGGIGGVGHASMTSAAVGAMPGVSQGAGGLGSVDFKDWDGAGKDDGGELDEDSGHVPQPDSTSGMKFEELYKLKDVLGTGAFSTVKHGVHRRNPNRAFAVKCVVRAKLTEEDAAALLDEVAILRELRHKHIIRLYDFFEEPTNYYLVMERMSGGELFDRVVAKAYYNEREARDVCKILLEAVGYCHEHGVAHRDLKPENLLLVSDKSDSDVKIADFGFAKKVLKPRSLTTQCGTPGYVAPEILSGYPYDTQADMWSVGVILYILLGGYPPFIDNNQRELFRKIRRGDYEFHEEYWGTVSTEAKSLISSLLTVDPAKRLSAADALKNSWIGGDAEELEQKGLDKNLQELRRYNAKRKFKAAVQAVQAAHKLQSLGKDFFKNLD